MAWYRAGSLAVTNGSAVVIGAGTAWVANVQAGHAINLPDGNAYEVLSVDSNTQITLGSPYLGASTGGQPYSVQPNQGFAQSAATRLSDFLSQIQNWVAGVLAGRFGDGSAAVPGISFAADQDTGIYRYGANSLAVATGGAPRMSFDGSYCYFNSPVNNVASTGASLILRRADTGAANLILNSNFPGGSEIAFTSGVNGVSNDGFAIAVNGAQRLIIDATGNLLVGVNSGSSHIIAKGQSVGTLILNVSGLSQGCANFFAAGGAAPSGAASAMAIFANPTSGRSINAGGTVNASGADYAEYMTKADGCGTIAKGDVCGVDRDGRLCRTWTSAVRFVVKSTDPNLVGGDTWAAHLPPRPDAPGVAPIEPTAPLPSAGSLPEQPVRGENEDEDAFIHRRVDYLIALSAASAAATADRDALAAYHAALAAYPAAKAEHDAAVATYEAALSAWEADLEAARQTVDRIAFSGQVPVNVDDDTLTACRAALADDEAVYLVAVARGAGIGATAVREADMTLPLYMRRIGAVWAIRDGRPWVDVQHG